VGRRRWAPGSMRNEGEEAGSDLEVTGKQRKRWQMRRAVANLHWVDNESDH